jgi:hypothetical protein
VVALNVVLLAALSLDVGLSEMARASRGPPDAIAASVAALALASAGSALFTARLAARDRSIAASMFHDGGLRGRVLVAFPAVALASGAVALALGESPWVAAALGVLAVDLLGKLLARGRPEPVVPAFVEKAAAPVDRRGRKLAGVALWAHQAKLK